MPLTADKMQLRVHLTKEQADKAKGPIQYRRAMLAQPKLLPGHKLPLVVGMWPDTPYWTREGILRAAEVWNERMAKHTGIPLTFKVVDVDSTMRKDVLVGVKPMDFHFDPLKEFGAMATGFLLATHRPGNPGFGSMDELGECVHYWDNNYRVYVGDLAAEVFIADDLNHRIDVGTVKGITAHELGHALLLGHDPHNPWRLMYRKHTGVMGPKPKECQWVEEIWT